MEAGTSEYIEVNGACAFAVVDINSNAKETTT